MRRIAAIFLLPIMLAVGLHPNMALHYCGDKLHSFGLMADNTDGSCCATLPDSGQEANNCCGNEGEGMHEEQACSLPSASKDECCDIQTLSISTDAYHLQSKSGDFYRLLPLYNNLSFTLAHAIQATSFVEPDYNKEAFPPDGLYLKDIDLLSYICVYQI